MPETNHSYNGCLWCWWRCRWGRRRIGVGRNLRSGYIRKSSTRPEKKQLESIKGNKVGNSNENEPAIARASLGLRNPFLQEFCNPFSSWNSEGGCGYISRASNQCAIRGHCENLYICVCRTGV